MVMGTVGQLDRLLPSVRKDVDAAVEALSCLPEVRRIWLFGSLAKGRRPDFRSDLDLAVEGLRAEDHLSALGRLEEVLQLPPDLVRWEKANPVLRQEIQQWGFLVYDRS
jgi:predicted nucleotidyltransferase